MMMKKIVYIYQVLLVTFVCGITSSCNDWLEVRPESETILEDYWRDESDVKSVVAACYRAMNEGGFIDRLIVWGEVRSDNVIKGPATNQNRDVERILDLMLNATNGYTSWFEFYRVINYCNSVIYYAPGVREKDPNFTEGQLRAYLAEVKGIRALCYFTLVRTFRDIPFLTDPVFDDSHSFNAPQADPDEIIKFLIDDLKGIETSSPDGFEKVEYDQGRITRKAIWALIADMSLWINDYQTCIEYCDKITGLTLENSMVYNGNLFFQLNTSSEIIFNLLFTDFSNGPVHSMYGDLLSSFDFKNRTSLFEKDDLRAMDFFVQNKVNDLFPIRKYIGYRQPRPGVTSENVGERDYIGLACYHWIFYRLADIYLMKAEALVERNTGNDLENAFDLVSDIFDRANPELGAGFLNFGSYNSQGAMRDLVFDERQREFLFEGKRYFDLLRRIKREGETTNVVSRYLVRKYSSMNQSTVLSKINNRDALYMPINENELKINLQLRQNPFYVVSSGISKN